MSMKNGCILSLDEETALWDVNCWFADLQSNLHTPNIGIHAFSYNYLLHDVWKTTKNKNQNMYFRQKS